MQELELCRRYFWEIGLLAIKQNLPKCVPRLAIRLSGGSQSHGNDDEISQDHGWGPGFAVWLISEDYEQFGEPPQAILKTLPREHLGYEWQDGRKGTSGVIEVGKYIKSAMGCKAPPKTVTDWLYIPAYLVDILLSEGSSPNHDPVNGAPERLCKPIKTTNSDRAGGNPMDFNAPSPAVHFIFCSFPLYKEF